MVVNFEVNENISHYIYVWRECDYGEWVVSYSSKYVVCDGYLVCK